MAITPKMCRSKGVAMERVFTWHAKYTRAIEKLPTDEDMAALTKAIIQYGTYGIEPEFDGYLAATFEVLKDDIDYSIKAHESGKKGGRPKKDVVEKSNSDSGQIGDNSKKGGFKGGLNPIHNNTIQNNTIHILRCPDCGKILTTTNTKTKSGKPVYKCPNCGEVVSSVFA